MKFAFNQAGLNALRTTSQMQTKVRAGAERVEASANAIPSTTSPAATEPYYEAYEAGDEKRARQRVVTTGIRAARHEVKTQALLRAVSSG